MATKILPKDVLYDAYWTQGLSLGKIGKKYGYTSTWVMKMLKHHDIKRRTLMEARKLRAPHSEQTKKKTSETMKKTLNDKKGEKHHAWKGGFYLTGQGYIKRYVAGHPHADKDHYVLEHRLVMEAHLGRYLTPEETVHHINGDKSDNRIENLQLFKTHGEHTAFHHQQRREN